MVALTSEPVRAGVVAGHRSAQIMRSVIGRGPRLTELLAVVPCATSILLTVAFLPQDAYASPALYATIEVLLAVAALTATWLLWRRFLRSRRRCDLLLAGGTLAFSILHVVTSAIPAALNDHPRGFLVATDIYGEFLVYAVFAAAAVGSLASRVVVGRRPDQLLGALSLSIAGVAAGVGFVLGPLVGASTAHGMASGDPLAIVCAAVACGLLSFSAVLGLREAADRSDRARLLVALGLVVMAGAPPLELSYIVGDTYSLLADTLQMIGFGLIGLAALRWELETRRLAERAAVLAERQRVARDLHDGLAQDLAFIAAHSSRIATDVGLEHPVVTAARRALRVSRSTIAELSDPTAATAHEQLEAIARELRQRFGITITLDVDLAHEPSPDAGEHLGRIMREAIVNALRHGEAHTVAVSLCESDGHVNLRVEDDGRGIDVVTSGRRQEGFGLRSIQQRAAGLGGHAELRQLGTSGTVLDVVLK